MKNVFISYRSTPYAVLQEYGCKVLEGKQCNYNNCDCEECSYKRALIFKNRQTDYECYILPPKMILPPNALLTAMDYLKFCPDLKRLISNMDDFIRFEIEEDSFWTNIELKFWQSYCKRTNKNHYYDIYLDEWGKTNEEIVTFTQMDKNEEEFYWRLMYYIQPEHRHDHGWGRYSNCFIQSCPHCGEKFLISLSALKYLINNHLLLSCFHCGSTRFAYHCDEQNNLFVFDEMGSVHSPLRVDEDLIVRLALHSNKEILRNLPLVCISNEIFPEMIPFTWTIMKALNLFRKIVVNGDLEIRIFNESTKSIKKISTVVKDL